MNLHHAVFAAALAALIAAGPALADSHGPAPNLASVWILHARDGQAGAFEEGMKTFLAAREQAGDPRAWQAFTVVAGGPLNAYGFRHCCFSWADQDAYDAWSLEHGMMERYAELVLPHVGEVEHYFTEMDFANSHWPEEAGPYALFGVTTWTPQPGKAQQLQGALSGLSAAGREHGWDGVWSWYRRIGGEEQLALVVPYENWAAMQPPEQTYFAFLTEHLGAEEAERLYADFTTALSPSEYVIYRHRPELSMALDEGEQ